MGTVCQKNTCTGCMACVNICQKGAIRIEDTLSAYNACIDADECVNCGRCREVCQNNYPIEVIKPISWKQGWADDPQVRESGSSGGAASAIAKKFIENGGVVCSCKFDNGEFVFDFADSTEMLRQFAGSKYVKSNPKGIYIKITELLKTKRVLFIGLPCQVAAVKKSIKSTLADNLYTIDLICHGTPSPKVLEVFLNQHGYKLKDIENIRFRRKGKFQITDGYKGVIATGVTDSYSISFLNGINYTDNCYQCKYAKIERVSDITLGDSWGTENESEMKKGVSLILCQSAKGESLIKDAELHLEAVDIKKAMENNHQLHEPSKKPEGRDAFMNGIEANKNYTRLVFKQYPKQSIRQLVKLILIKMKVMRGGC